MRGTTGVVLAIVIALLLYTFLPDTRPVTTETVWTYWHAPVQPTIVRRCIRNWRNVGKVKDIRVLNAFTVHKYIPWSTLRYFSSITSCEAHKSDLIRFYLLDKYGGVWIDASVFCNQPLDWLPDGFFCYKADRFSKDGVTCLENFFIKSPKGYPFLKSWMEQTIREFTDPDYKTTNEKYRRIIGQNGDYLVPYVASMKLDKPMDITLHSAEDDPYYDTVRENWNPQKTCNTISYTTKLVKLWNASRNACALTVVPLADTGAYTPKGIYKRFKHKFKPVGENASNEVDMIYCICMPARVEYATEQLKAFGQKYKLLDAIKPDDLTPDDYRNLSQTYNPLNQHLYKQMTKLCVCLSFFMCYYDAYNNGFETILIVEDDIKYQVSLAQIFEAIRQFKTTEGQIMFLGYCWSNCDKPFTQLTEHVWRAPKDAQLLCNHALVCKKEFLARYMERDGVVYWKHRNDHTLSDWLRDTDTFKCVTTKAFINQNRAELGSNNGNYDLGGKACDFSSQHTV